MYLNVNGQEVQILHATADDWEGAMALAWRTFSQFEALYYPPEGCESFIEFISGNDLRKMFMMGRYRMFVAKCDEKLVGLISIREHNHISLLFVDSAYQSSGIGRALLKAAEDYLWDRDILPLDNEEDMILDILYNKEEEHFVTVNAAPSAVQFYIRCGFEQEGPQMEDSGIIYVPLRIRE
ncbi:MAG: GNAT family N-acetyltransferase [Lachnospiraceae bacterium]|nr:GNAT family N-acetyltransferase [Lachnospiraceae bacterium]